MIKVIKQNFSLRSVKILGKIYLDNGATSYPKPQKVIDSMVNYMTKIGASPGRGGYSSSLDAGRIVMETRSKLSQLFDFSYDEGIIFTQNITQSLNMAIKGILNKGDHVIISSMEHNSVVRPLRSLEQKGIIEVSVIPCKIDGSLPIDVFQSQIKKNTKMIVLTHSSNVTGVIMPVAEVGEISRENNIVFVLDSAQTAGLYPISFKDLNLDILAFTGHKGLMGPQGIGGFCIQPSLAKKMLPIFEGGTGSKSDHEYQPDFIPDKFESGTLNMPGIAGLFAGIEFIQNTGLDNIQKKEHDLLKTLVDGIEDISGVITYRSKDLNLQTPTLSIEIENLDSAEVSYILDDEFGIMTRSGLHCSPLAHKTIGTFPRGTLRLSIGYFNTEDEIIYTIESLRKIVKR